MSLRYSVYFVLTFFIYLMCDDLYFSDFGFFNLCGPKQLKVFEQSYLFPFCVLLETCFVWLTEQNCFVTIMFVFSTKLA